MCRIHDWQHRQALPPERGGAGAVFIPNAQRCTRCNAERLVHTIRWDGPRAERVQAPAAPYVIGADAAMMAD